MSFIIFSILEIEQFYKEIKQVLREVQRQNRILITGDFNARVGENATERDVTGKIGHGTRNKSGQTLIDFCSGHNLVITSALFRLHNRHRYTWKSPDGNTRTEIDYIMISKHSKQAIHNSHTNLSADRFRSQFSDTIVETQIQEKTN